MINTPDVRKVAAPFIVGLLAFALSSCCKASPSSISTSTSSTSPSTTTATSAPSSTPAISLSLVGAVHTNLRSAAPVSCTSGVDAFGAKELTIDLPAASAKQMLYLAVPKYAGQGTYAAKTVVDEDGGTAVIFRNMALGVSRPQYEYDATSGTIDVTSVSGSTVSGSVAAILRPFGTAPGQVDVSGSWSCTLG